MRRSQKRSSRESLPMTIHDSSQDTNSPFDSYSNKNALMRALETNAQFPSVDHIDLPPPVVEPEATINIRSYRAIYKKGFIFHVKHPFAFEMLGYMKITILCGGVHIYGYDLTKESISTTIFVYGSQLSHSYMIETRETFKANVNDLNSLADKMLLKDDCDGLKCSMGRHDAILLMEEIALLPFFQSPYCPSSIAPFQGSVKTLCPQVLKEMKCAINYPSKETSKTFRDLEGVPSKKTIIFGPCGVGKTGCLRFLLNNALVYEKAVVYIDLDLGQGEFCPPGTIGVYLIKEPVFGPNFTHVLHPETLLHIGEVSVVNVLKEYIINLKKLLRFVDDNPDLQRLPCLINTMGFFKGVGMTLARAIVAIIQPTHLIQMYKTTDGDMNFDPATFRPQSNFLADERSIGGFRYSRVKAVSHSNLKEGINNKLARERMLLATLSQMLRPPYYTFNTVEPYVVKFANVVIGTNVEEKMVLSTLNGSLVALSALPYPCHSKTTSCNLRILPKRALMNTPCLGLGLIRGIDPEKEDIHVLSYLTPRQMVEVKLLTISGINPPPDIFLRQEGVIGEVPYTTHNPDKLSHVPIRRLPAKRLPCLVSQISSSAQ